MVLLAFGFLLVLGCMGEEAPTGQEGGGNEPVNIIPPGFNSGADLPIVGAEVERERCEDTDNGYEIHWKGTTTLFEEGEEKWVNVDYCWDSGTLVEYYCENGALTHDSVKCPCSNGVCDPILDFVECIDTDLGNERYIKGKIQLTKHYTDGRTEVQYPVEDECISRIELIEYFCKDDGSGEFRNVVWTCIMCENGVCTR